MASYLPSLVLSVMYGCRISAVNLWAQCTSRHPPEYADSDWLFAQPPHPKSSHPLCATLSNVSIPLSRFSMSELWNKLSEAALKDNAPKPCC